jgi:hypothetical protein
VKRLIWPLIGVSAAALVVCAFAFGGPTALQGALLGLAATGFSIGALWWIIRLSSSGQAGPKRTPVGTTLVVLAFFVKLPLFIALGALAHRIGGHAPACFLMGLALVYFALVGWALAQS